MSIVDINNPNNYKNCFKKSYDMYVCKPPKNTLIIDKLKNPNIVKMFNGKTYFSSKDIDKIHKENQELFNKLFQLVSQGYVYAVTDNTPFVLASLYGDMSVININELQHSYAFVRNNQPLRIDNNTIQERSSNDYMQWSLVRFNNSRAEQQMACFIPNSQKLQLQTKSGVVVANEIGTNHSKGDFVLCSKLPNGQPNLTDRWLVNGNLFPIIYNNNGWTDCIKINNNLINIQRLPDLITGCNVSKDYSEEFKKFTEELKLYLGTVVNILGEKVNENNSEILKIDGDNDDSLALRIRLDNATVILLGKSDKISLDKKYKIEEINTNIVAKDILSTLNVSPIRREVKKIPEYLNSRGIKCSSIKFGKLKCGFTFKFIIDSLLLFTYSIDLEDKYKNKNCSLLHVKYKDGKLAPYNYDASLFNLDTIYNEVKSVLDSEKSSWGNIIKKVINSMENIKRYVYQSKSFSFLIYNRGEGKYRFRYKNYEFNLLSYSDSYFSFKCTKSFDFNHANLGVLDLNFRKPNVELAKMIDTFIDNLASTSNKEEGLKILNKAYKDYEDLIYSDEISKKLSKFEYESTNANFVYKLFLAISSIDDIQIYVSDNTNNIRFSFDDDIFICCRHDDNGDYISLEADSFLYIQPFFEGNLDELNMDNIDLFLHYLQDSCSDYIPYQLNHFYDYDITYSFWINYKRMLSELEDLISEYSTNGRLSFDSYEVLTAMCKSNISKLRISNLDKIAHD